MELLTLIFRANSRKDKVAVLEEARERIKVIRSARIASQCGPGGRIPDKKHRPVPLRADEPLTLLHRSGSHDRH